MGKEEMQFADPEWQPPVQSLAPSVVSFHPG